MEKLKGPAGSQLWLAEMGQLLFRGRGLVNCQLDKNSHTSSLFRSTSIAGFLQGNYYKCKQADDE